jgi:putative transposase
LNQRLWVWIEQVYHRSEHSGLGTTPLLRWQRDIESIVNFHPAPIYVACSSIA